MGNAVEINFQAGGIENVLSAFRSIDASIARLEKQFARLASVHDRASDGTAKKVRDNAAQEERVAKRLADYKTKVQLETSRMTSKAIDLEMRENERAEDRKRREADKTARYLERVRRNSIAMAQAAAEEEARAVFAARQRINRAVGTSLGRGISGAFGGATHLAGAALAIGGGFSTADAIRSRLDQASLAKDVELRSTSKGGTVRPFTSKQLLQSATATAMQYGMDTQDVLEGASTFVKSSGAGSSVLGMLPRLAELARGGGVSMQDISLQAAQFMAQTKDADATMRIMRHMIGVGRENTLDIADIGMYGGRVAAASAKFQDKEASSKFFINLMQSAKAGGATDAAEASEAISKFVDTLEKKRGDIEAIIGRSVYNKTAGGGVILDAPQKLMIEMLKKTGGMAGGLTNIFTDVRARKALGGAENAYREAFVAAGGRAGVKNTAAEAAGIEAVQAIFAEMDKAALSQEAVTAQATEAANDEKAKLTAAIQGFNSAVGDTLVPVTTKLIQTITDLTPKFAWLLDRIVSNPWDTVATAISAKIAGSFVSDVVTSKLTAALSGSMSASLPVAIGAALAGAAVTIQLTKAIVDFAYGNAERETSAAAIAGTNEIAAAMSAPDTVEGLQKKKDAAKTLQNLIEKRTAENPSNVAGFDQVTGFLAHFVGPSYGEKHDKATAEKAASNDAMIANLGKNLETLNAAIEASSKRIAAADFKRMQEDIGLSTPNKPISVRPHD